MLISFKSFLPALSAPLFGAAMLGTAALAQDVSAPSARLGQLETQMSQMQSRLQVAQGYGYGRPPGNVGNDDYNSGPSQDAAGLEVRINHLEEQMRQMNGQIEQMQNSQHKLEDQLRKFQQDVDFRFQDNGRGAASGKPQKRTDATDSDMNPPSNPSANASTGTEFSPVNAPLHGTHRGDAFDPAADPNAPGAPRQLGSIASTATALPPPESPKPIRNPPSIIQDDDEENSDAPLDLSSGKRSAAQPSSTPSNTPPGFGTAAAPRQIPLTPQATPNNTLASTSTQATGVPPIASPKDEFDAALGYFRQKEYENAEKSFSAFLQKNPKNKMTAEATYYLGETYYLRGREREAAEQYLKISTNYSTSTKAPEAMLRLGESLNKMGAKEQACATFGEVPRKYPNASAAVKSNAELAAKNAKC